ncbi:helix-turn-helix domain-containing protein [Spirosoma flavum]|uniref:Helix-turn-helix domain-containing protein n=1 Tax=Spirosoma flavum TaxID=2048557 RepID=A0ABW6AIG2_9BACT
MKFQPYLPCDRLKPYIKQFVISESNDERTYKVLPDISLVMGFQYRGKLAYVDKTAEVPLATSGITGIQDGFRLFKNSSTIGSVLVVFTETGAASFLSEPINELFGESLPLDTFVDSTTLNSIEDQLASVSDDWDRIRIVEQFLLSRFQETKADLLVALALQHIYQSKGTIRIAALAKNLCISQSPLEKRFRNVVGTSPKKFSSIVRMKQAITLFPTAGRLTEIGLESGYFDQAHFINEFKIFTGVTPSEFMQASLNPNQT